MSAVIPCVVLIPFDGHLPGAEILLTASRANELGEKCFVKILWDKLDANAIGDQIVSNAEKEKEMLRELIRLAPDDLSRQTYKRRLKKLEDGDLRP